MIREITTHEDLDDFFRQRMKWHNEELEKKFKEYHKVIVAAREVVRTHDELVTVSDYNGPLFDDFIEAMVKLKKSLVDVYDD